MQGSRENCSCFRARDILRTVMHAPIFVHTPREEDWQVAGDEGQLSVDVCDAGKDLVIVAPMAGADAREIDVSIHDDLLTIRGIRLKPEAGSPRLHEECFWGRFSRTLVLPVEVKSEVASAEYANGMLIIRVPKRQADAHISVRIV